MIHSTSITKLQGGGGGVRGHYVSHIVITQINTNTVLT